MNAVGQQLLTNAAACSKVGRGSQRQISRSSFSNGLLSTVVNAADADHMCLWHRVAVCSAHGHAGSIASPGGGPLSFRACSKASTAIATAVPAAAVLTATPIATRIAGAPPPPRASIAATALASALAATTLTLTTAAAAAAIAATALTTPPCICLNYTYGAFY